MTDHLELAGAASHSTQPAQRRTVILVDDHAVMLESVRAVVQSDDLLTVVGTASRVSDAIKLARLTQPDVAVIDVNMPEGGGWAAARGLREAVPDIRLVAYSSFEEAMIVRTIAAAGISAFISKGADIDQLLAAIHGVDTMPTPQQPTPLLSRKALAPGA